MADLLTVSRPCGTVEPKGTKTTLYVTVKGELTGWPQTREEVVLAASGTPAQGDSKILDEAFDFSAAATGKGFWRSAPFLQNTGAVTNRGQGDLGGRSMENEIVGFVPGNNSATKEFIDCLLAYDGCLIGMLLDKSGRCQVAGHPDEPLQVEIQEGGTGGDRVGYSIRLYCDTGVTNMEYDADTHGIDTTPNA
jgi:hypothetical protein